ncbi:hypothetical protein LCGC14_0470130 [marine sediment metagenome]|uniref:DUF268 domain-containing protein n=1 Tax=marine sediment metagenome TaxID=412755 RepID=A0A0F9VLB9_9ZZZZ
MINSKSMVGKICSDIINFKRLKIVLPRLLDYFKDKKNYLRMDGVEPIALRNYIPLLYDKNQVTPFDAHYFFQDIWASKKIFESKCSHHVDVGSHIKFIGFLTTFTKVTFIDIRPLPLKFENFQSKKGNILSLDYEDNSVKSLSCLHVAEHIGLGRYGDNLDPLGTKKAIKELSRILAPNGNLYFSIPIGKPKLYFNSHRIHSTDQIMDYFSDLEMVELSGIDDKANYHKDINKKALNSCKYGCGLFYFTKK